MTNDNSRGLSEIEQLVVDVHKSTSTRAISAQVAVRFLAADLYKSGSLSRHNAARVVAISEAEEGPAWRSILAAKMRMQPITARPRRK